MNAMTQVLTSAAEATPEWLTETLRRSGALEAGHVLAVDHQSVPGRASKFLKLQYSPDAPADAPKRLFLKLTDTDIRLGVPGLGKVEPEFYNAVADSNANLPLVRCYDAVYSAEKGCNHLLLDDLSETHIAVRASQLPPTIEQCEQIVDALAQIHAYWWDHPRLGNEVGERPTEQGIRESFAEDVANVDEFISFLGDRLSAERQRVFECLTSGLLPLLLKRLTGKNLTVIFEDVHIGNFLYPRDSSQHRLVIIDWEQWAISIGANDLAYMMAVFWFPERRARLERPLLERYLRGLTEYGVKNYAWDDLWYDYRLAVLKHLLMPAWRWKHNGPPDIWWNHLERLMLAYSDLGCAELLS